MKSGISMNKINEMINEGLASAGGGEWIQVPDDYIVYNGPYRRVLNLTNLTNYNEILYIVPIDTQNNIIFHVLKKEIEYIKANYSTCITIKSNHTGSYTCILQIEKVGNDFQLVSNQTVTPVVFYR